MLTKIKSFYNYACRYVGAMEIAPTKGQVQICLFLLGVVVLTAGVGVEAMAQQALTGQGNYDRISNASNTLLQAIQGPFGALVMIVAGIFAIVMAAMGKYSVAMSLLVISLGSFILRSIIGTFFNDKTLGDGQ